MFNKIIVIGNLTKDIEIKFFQNGGAVSKGSIATSYKYKSQDATQKEETCFLDFNIFGKTAEIANQYLKKGSKVMFEGKLVLETWTSDGQNRSKHSLKVETVKMLGNDNYSNYGKETEIIETQQKTKEEKDLSDVPEICPF